MSKRVRATERGYFGGEIREAGDKFTIPLAVWESKKARPSWVEAVAGAVAVEPAKTETAVSALSSMTIPELRELAGDEIDLTGLTVKADIIKAIEAGPDKGEPAKTETEVFGDAPAPGHVKAENSVTKEIGGVGADWIAPGTAI